MPSLRGIPIKRTVFISPFPCAREKQGNTPRGIPFLLSICYNKIGDYVKKLVSLLFCAAFFLSGLFSGSARAEANVHVVESFSYMAGARSLTEEPFWYEGKNPSLYADFAGGRLTLMGKGVAAFHFRFGSDPVSKSWDETEKADGWGFYVENNTARDVPVNLFLIGNACIQIAANGVATLVSPEGEATETPLEDGFVVLRPGFRGYLMAENRYLVNNWAEGRPYNPKEDLLSAFGLQVGRLSFNAGESFVIDDVFLFGNVTPKGQAAVLGNTIPPGKPSSLPVSPVSSGSLNGPGDIYMWIGGAGMVLVLAAFTFSLYYTKPPKKEKPLPPDPNDVVFD